jgi:hypothetical protein
MAYTIHTSIHGRRLGLNQISSAQSGSRSLEFLTGPDALRMDVTTAETTGTQLKPFGLSVVFGTSVASSAVYVLDPPIPGIKKVIHFGSTADMQYVRTAGAETIRSSGASTSATFTVVKSSAGGTVELIGLSTAVWLAVNAVSTLSGVSFAATT